MICPTCGHEKMDLVCVETVIGHYEIENDLSFERVDTYEVFDSLGVIEEFIQCQKCFEEFNFHRDEDEKLIIDES